jgi:hypothetical protein
MARQPHDWWIAAVIVVILVVTVAVVMVPVYGECRGAGHSLPYCLWLLG